MTLRLDHAFARLRAEQRAGFVAYVMAGDPDVASCWSVLNGLPGAGADIVELGFPFSDPTADGPSIQRAGERALKAGVTLDDVLALARRFRDAHADVPLILMGYANPVHARGWAGFADAAAQAGADGAIVVDLPPEEDGPLNAALSHRGLSLIRLAAPTSDAERLPTILENATGFLYYVSVTGVTGAGAATEDAVRSGVARIRALSALPVAVGFGVRAPEQARAIARHADAVVVGSAIVDALSMSGREAALETARVLADAVRTAR